MDPDQCQFFEPRNQKHVYFRCTWPCPHCGYSEHQYEDMWNNLSGKQERRCIWCDKLCSPSEIPQVTVCEARERTVTEILDNPRGKGSTHD